MGQGSRPGASEKTTSVNTLTSDPSRLRQTAMKGDPELCPAGASLAAVRYFTHTCSHVAGVLAIVPRGNEGTCCYWLLINLLIFLFYLIRPSQLLY